MRLFIQTVFLLLFFPLMAHAQSTPPKPAQGWWNADNSSAHIAPLPEKESRAVVQIYTARAYGWRKYLAVHSWVAVKEQDAKTYTVYQVIGWLKWRNQSVISIKKDLPDRHWYGEKPILIFSEIGDDAARMIPFIEKASASYPYPNDYTVWPGPNSNSYIAHIIRHTPGITVELPPHAIGKDWIDDGKFFAPSESKTGWQFSFYGLLGLTIGKAEGFEINILGMSFGFDVMSPALKLPFIGRIGMTDKPV